MVWSARAGLRPKQETERKKEVCLVDAFRSLGLKQIPYETDGPLLGFG